MSNHSRVDQLPQHTLLPENHQGRDFIVSDLHGYRSALDKALSQVNFCTTEDRLISVGDLIDRGPESDQCLALLNEPWFYAVCGNHEQMLIDAVTKETENCWSRWLLNGGGWSLQHGKGQLQRWAQQLATLPLTITLPCRAQTVGICHAEYTGLTWQTRKQNHAALTQEMIWGRSRLHRQNSAPIAAVDWVFSGHTVVPDIQILGNSVFIERGAYLDNGLTLIDLPAWLQAQADASNTLNKAQ